MKRSKMNSFVKDIPVIDVKGLTYEQEDVQELAAQIKDAFMNIGFVAITNHNISEDVVSTRGRTRGARAPPRPPKMRPQHQNSTKLRPQNGSFRP